MRGARAGARLLEQSLGERGGFGEMGDFCCLRRGGWGVESRTEEQTLGGGEGFAHDGRAGFGLFERGVGAEVCVEGDDAGEGGRGGIGEVGSRWEGGAGVCGGGEGELRLVERFQGCEACDGVQRCFWF